MDNKIQKYLEDIAFIVTPEQYTEMFNDANALDTKSWLDKYKNDAMQDETLAATWRDYGFDKYSKNKWERMAETFGSSDKENPFDKPEPWLKAQWAKDYSDITFEEFKSDVEKNKKFWEDEKRAREYEAGKIKRTKEVKNWPPFKNLLASEYSKQRYINEPEKSIFSNEGEWYNKGEDVSDVALGVLGLAGDFIPYAGALVGPSVRLTRDITHKLSHSPYQKDWSQIGKDAGLDYAVNLGAWKLANAKKANATKADIIASEMTDDVVKNAINVDKETKDIVSSIKKVDTALRTPNITDSDLFKVINNLPDTEYKNALVAEAKGWLNKPINRKNIFDINTTYFTQTYPEALEVYKLRAAANKPPLDVFESVAQLLDDEGREAIYPIRKLVTEPTEYVQKRISTPTYDELSKMQKAQYKFKNFMSANNRGDIGQRVTQVGKRLVLDPNVNTKEELAKEWYKQNYDRDWNLDFKPTAKEGDLKWEAYREWYYNKYGKFPPEEKEGK